MENKNKKCYICNYEINKNDGQHIYICAKKNNKNLSKKDIKFEQIRYSFPKLDYDLIKELYLDNKYSLPDFKKEFGIDYKSLQFLLDYFNIEKRSIKEANSLSNRSNKFKNTCKEKYGVENISQLDTIKKKKKETFLKNYGYDNIWKDPNYRIWWEEMVKNKFGKICLADIHGNQNFWGWIGLNKEERKIRNIDLYPKYKKWYDSLSEDKRIELNQKKGTGILLAGRSKLEYRIEEILCNFKIKNKPQYWINRKSYDFLIDDNILLEINGDYWHCNPEIYKEDDIVNFGGEMTLVSQVWEKDLLKKKNAEDFGYKVFYIWEKEMKNITDNDLFNKIKNFLDENKKYKKD